MVCTSQATSSCTQNYSTSTRSKAHPYYPVYRTVLTQLRYVAEKTGTDKAKPVYLVFHGGSGSTLKEYQDAISYGVVKVNLDTDLQWAYLTGIRDYVLNKKDYLATQVGNPDGADKPNKKYYDPRVWVREGEKTMTKRVTSALKDFNTAGQL
jgi:fructose-bisphosphate aldolase class II